MIRRKSGKDGPGKNRAEKWERNPVECGTQHRGWLAGPPFGVWVHYTKDGSQPCLSEMTDHALVCPHCAICLPSDWRGYTPYYDEQYTQRFVMITFEYEEAVLEIEHLAPIVMRRGKKKTDPIVIEQKLWRTTPIPHSPKRINPVCLDRFLVFTLWKNQALIDWCRKAPYVAPQPPTPKPEDTLYNDPSTKKLRRMMEREAHQKEEDKKEVERIGATINRLTTPKPNGVYVPPKG